MKLPSHFGVRTGIVLLGLVPTALVCAQDSDKANSSGAITTSATATSLRNPDLKHDKVEKKNDKIWSAVILATSVEKPKETPAELKEFAPRLKKIFGYNQFEMEGSATEEIDELTENWLLPSPVFPLSVTARPALAKEARGGYLLDMKVFQGKQHLVDTEVKLAPGSPLFIRGPLYGKGQIIIALQVRR